MAKTEESEGVRFEEWEEQGVKLTDQTVSCCQKFTETEYK